MARGQRVRAERGPMTGSATKQSRLFPRNDFWIASLRSQRRKQHPPSSRSHHRRNQLGDAVVGRLEALLDACIELAVAIFLAAVEDGRRQRGLAALLDEGRGHLIFVAGEA